MSGSPKRQHSLPQKRAEQSVAQYVGEIAASHGVEVDTSSRAYRLARDVSRIEGIEGDETLDLIAELMRLGAFSAEQGISLCLTHHDETRHADGPPTEDAGDPQEEYGMGPLR